MKKLFLFLIVINLFVLNNAFPQKEASYWFFGRNSAGIKFINGVPSYPGEIFYDTAWEGCATISDKTTGDFLFYTNGIQVINKRGRYMPHGDSLWGHSSSTQSAVIVPKPGSDSLYYIFTADAQAGKEGGYGGIAYSMVDMTLDGGNGDVTTKNQPLLTPACEKIAAVKHCNGKDVWVVVHQWNTDAFYTYLVTSSGINAPVISHTGSVIKDIGSGHNNEAIGYLKFSPDGKKLATANYRNMNTVELFGFDNGTGIISNPSIDNKFSYSDKMGGTYGLSFSPDNTKLYLSTVREIYQYDLSFGNLSSRKLIAVASQAFSDTTLSEVLYGSLQIGQDGKIYVANMGNINIGYTALGRINRPNNTGLLCDYIPEAIYFGGFSTCLWGLPNFIESYFNNLFLGVDIKTCANQATLDAKNTGATYLWSTGETTQKISVTTNGNYWVKVNNKGCIMSDTIQVTLNSSSVNLGSDTILCSPSYTLYAEDYNANYLWSTGDTLPRIKVSKTGNYWVKVINASCIASDTVFVNFDSIPKINLGNDTIICGNSIALDAGFGYKYYKWGSWWASMSNEQTQATIASVAKVRTTVKPVRDEIALTVSNSVCTARDWRFVTFMRDTSVNLGKDVTVCDSSYTLKSNIFALDIREAKYLWSTGDTTEKIAVYSTGKYWLQASFGNCISSDTINVTFLNGLKVNLGKDTTVCNPTFTLDAGVSGLTYLWSTRETKQKIQVNKTGNYWVKTVSGQCTAFDTINVTFLSSPAVNLGKDTAVCDTVYILNANNAGAKYVWSTGDTTQIIKARNNGKFWVTIDNTCKSSDTINLILFSPPQVNLGNDTSLCDNVSYTLTAGNTGAKYLWSTTDTTPIIKVKSSGKYWVQVLNNNCTNSDTMKINFTPVPIVNLGSDTVLCNPITLNAENTGASYQWSTGDTSKAINASNDGIYWVKVSKGVCVIYDSIKITLNVPVVDLGEDIITCKEKIIDAGNTGALYLWNTGDTTRQITIKTTGEYWVQVDNGNCSSSDTLNITIALPVSVNLGEDIVSCNGKIVLDAGNKNKFFLWSTGETQQTISITQDGNYWVRVSDGNCDVADTIAVSFIEEQQPVLVAPNVFTPNNDTYNDVLDFSVEKVEAYHLHIYNRWGDVVFETENKDKKWDGTTTNGKEVPAGIYYWVVDYKLICETGQTTEKGFVHLIR